MMTDSEAAYGTVEPWLRLHGQSYSREQAFAIFVKAESGEDLSEQEYRVAAAWCVHPLNCNERGLMPYTLASFIRNRDQARQQIGSSNQDAKEQADAPRRSEAR